jgi:hypothetical protein
VIRIEKRVAHSLLDAAIEAVDLLLEPFYYT